MQFGSGQATQLPLDALISLPHNGRMLQQISVKRNVELKLAYPTNFIFVSFK
jgi:hypothetical protein